MNKGNFSKRMAAAIMMATLVMLPITAIAQTRIVAPKNKYKIQDDIKLGNDAARDSRAISHQRIECPKHLGSGQGTLHQLWG